MRLKQLIATTFAILILPQTAVGQKAAPDIREGGYLERFLLLPAADHTDARLKELTREFSDEIRRTHRIGILWVFPKLENLYSLQGARAWSSPFPDWRRVWIEESDPPFPVCRITILGKNAVVERRDRNGSVSRFVVDRCRGEVSRNSTEMLKRSHNFRAEPM